MLECFYIYLDKNVCVYIRHAESEIFQIQVHSGFGI